MQVVSRDAPLVLNAHNLGLVSRSGDGVREPQSSRLALSPCHPDCASPEPPTPQVLAERFPGSALPSPVTIGPVCCSLIFMDHYHHN